MDTKDRRLFGNYLWDMPNISVDKMHHLINSTAPTKIEKSSNQEAIAIKVMLNRVDNIFELKEVFPIKEFKKLQKFYSKFIKTNMSLANSEIIKYSVKEYKNPSDAKYFKYLENFDIDTNDNTPVSKLIKVPIALEEKNKKQMPIIPLPKNSIGKQVPRRVATKIPNPLSIFG